jgi:hypothetical protein
LLDHPLFSYLVVLALVVLYRTFTRLGPGDGERRGVIAMSIAAFLFGAWELEGALLPLWRAHRARTWSTTSGTVVSSEVRSTSPGRRSAFRQRYYAHVGTAVTFDGVLDTVWRVGVTRDPGPEERARAIAARYPTGAQVRLFYDPARPWAAVLEREAPPLSPWRVVMGSVLVAGALGLALSMARRRT